MVLKCLVLDTCWIWSTQAPAAADYEVGECHGRMATGLTPCTSLCTQVNITAADKQTTVQLYDKALHMFYHSKAAALAAGYTCVCTFLGCVAAQLGHRAWDSSTSAHVLDPLPCSGPMTARCRTS